MITALFVLGVIFLCLLLLGIILEVCDEDEAAEIAAWAWTAVGVALAVLVIIQAARAWTN